MKAPPTPSTSTAVPLRLSQRSRARFPMAKWRTGLGITAVVVAIVGVTVGHSAILLVLSIAGLLLGGFFSFDPDANEPVQWAMSQAAKSYGEGNVHEAERWLLTVLAMPPAAAGLVRRSEASALLAIISALSGRIAEARDAELAFRDEGVAGQLYADAVAGAVAFARGRMDDAARFLDPIPKAVAGDLTKKKPAIVGLDYELWDAVTAIRREAWRRRGYPVDSLPQSSGPIVEGVMLASGGVGNV